MSRPPAHSNQRGYYRVVYPLSERPTLRVDEDRLEVVDCSETGLSYALPETEAPPRVGTALSGRLLFRDGDEVDVEGIVARVVGRTVALRFTAGGVPYAKILAEQKRLRKDYLAPRGSRS